MLNIITGVSGSGKSYRVFDEIMKQAGKEPDREFFIIVPEQFTLAAQREILERTPRHGIMNIDILSFPRLAHRLFEEMGLTPPVTLEDTGKTMIVKKVVLDRKEELEVFAGNVHKQGFIEQMKSVIAEFYQYSVDLDELGRMSDMAKGRPQLEKKLRDIYVIYKGFRDFISGRFIMNEELLGILADMVERSSMLSGAVLCFDGFTGFTAIQYRVMEKLLKVAKDIYITVTIDGDYVKRLSGNGSMFDLSAATIEKLSLLAEEQNGPDSIRITDISKNAENGIPFRFRSSLPLAGLEKNIFRHPVEKCREHEDIRLLSCPNPRSEIQYVIGEIRRLTFRSDGYRFSEIAVIAGDLNSYSRLAQREFAKAGIPVFIDTKKSIAGLGAVELIRSMISAARLSFDSGSVFAFLKTGFSGLDNEETAYLENYCLACLIRGEKAWKREWTRKYNSRYEIDMEKLNRLREKVCSILIEPAARLKGDLSVSERIGIINGVLEALQVREKLEKSASVGRESQSAEIRNRALEDGQLYDDIMSVFERIVLLLGDDHIPLDEFSQILDTGFKEAKLAMIPSGRDSVVFGDMERTRLGPVKVLFFIGANDGQVPKSQDDLGILSLYERMIFDRGGMELKPVGLKSSYLSEFYLYLNLTKPSERLYLSYHRMTPEKKPGHKAYIFSKIMEIFPGLSIRPVQNDDRDMLVGAEGGVLSAARIIRENARNKDNIQNTESTLLEYVRSNMPEAYGIIRKAVYESRRETSLKPENAAALYGRVLTGSVTRLEKYASCAYAHFIRYGLKLEERPEFKVGSIELGNIYHKAVEEYGKLLKSGGKKWHEVEEDERIRLTDIAAETALNEYADIISDNSRNAYLRSRVRRVLQTTVSVLDYQVKSGSFEPDYFEESFQTAGDFMELSGKIDRIDTVFKGNRKYLRVIDYKSGKKQFDLAKLYNGLQIQLAVYMNEAVRLCDNALVSGLYYYNIDDPFIEGSFESDPTEAVLSKLKLHGPSGYEEDQLVLTDRVLADEEGRLAAGQSSKIVDVDIKKDGTFGSRSKILSEKQFEYISQFAGLKLKRQAHRILEGDIEAAPYKQGQYSACTYCPYGGICGFDTDNNDRYRFLPKMDENELWNRISEEINENGRSKVEPRAGRDHNQQT